MHGPGVAHWVRLHRAAVKCVATATAVGAHTATNVDANSKTLSNLTAAVNPSTHSENSTNTTDLA